MLWDLGPFRGRLPQVTVMIDRADGTLWALQHTLDPPTADGLGYVSISDVLPTWPDKLIYAAFDGPILSNDPRVRLLVRGGMLGYEIETLPGYFTDRDQARVTTRRGWANESREIILPVGWRPGDTLAWTPISFTHPPDPYL